MTATACAVPFAQAGVAASSTCSCDDPPGNPGGGYCTPGPYSPLPTPEDSSPSTSTGSPSIGLPPGAPTVAYPCLAVAFPVV